MGFWLCLIIAYLKCAYFNNIFIISLYIFYHYIIKPSLFLVFTQSQETQNTVDIAAILVSQTKEMIKILLLRVHQHGRHDVRWKQAIRAIFMWQFLFARVDEQNCSIFVWQLYLLRNCRVSFYVANKNCYIQKIVRVERQHIKLAIFFMSSVDPSLQSFVFK